MPDTNAFIDTNILLYTLSADKEKADGAEAILHTGGLISVQVLNEFTHVARRKLNMSWMEIGEVISIIRSICPVEPLTEEIHDSGRAVAERYGLSVYDAMIVAAALAGGCHVLYSEDMQDGMIIKDQLRICNPFSKKV